MRRLGLFWGRGGMQWYLNFNLDPGLFPAWVYPRFPDIWGAGIVEGITNVLLCGMPMFGDGAACRMVYAKTLFEG